MDPIDVLFCYGDAKVEWSRGEIVFLGTDSAEVCDVKGFLRSVLAVFVEERDLGEVTGGGFLLRVSSDVVRAPDAFFVSKPKLSRIGPTHCEGRADLVIEIVSPDSRMRNRGEKFYEYERAGIEEYWIVDPDRKSAEFYRLADGVYRPVLPDAEGKVYSSTLPGFFIRVDWLWNRPKVLDALRELGVV